MGHEYTDVLTLPTAIIKDVIQSSYEERALENILEDDKNFESEMERSRKYYIFASNFDTDTMQNWLGLRHPELYQGVKTGAIKQFRTDQALSLKDISLIHKISQYTIKFPDGTRRGI